MRFSRLEDQFCATCGRVEKVEVQYDQQVQADGGRVRAPLSASCRIGHDVSVDDLT